MISITNRQIIIPPINGWEQNCVYLVEISMNKYNPIFLAILHVGFVNKDGSLGNYSKITEMSCDEISVKAPVYIRFLKKLINIEKMHENTNSGKMLSDIKLSDIITK